MGAKIGQKRKICRDRLTNCGVNPYSPSDARVLLIAGSHFIEKKTSSGKQKISGPSAKTFTDISAGFRKDGKPLIYIIGDESAFASDDEGTTWRKASLSQGGGKMRAIATSLRNPDTAYVSYRELEEGGIKWLGVAKTTNAGRTWQPIWKEDSNPAAKPSTNVHDAWITERFGSDWGENPLALAVAEQDANLSYGTDLEEQCARRTEAQVGSPYTHENPAETDGSPRV